MREGNQRHQENCAHYRAPPSVVDVQARNLIAERARQARQDFFDRQAEQPMLVARVPRLPDLTGPASLPPPPGSLALWRRVPEPAAPVPAPTPASRAQQMAATDEVRIEMEILERLQQERRAAAIAAQSGEPITVPALGTPIQATISVYRASQAPMFETLFHGEDGSATRTQQTAASRPARLSPR